MKSIPSRSRIFNFSFWSWTLATVALTFGFALTATATVPLFQNNSVLDFVVPGTPPPTIDALNFVNNNQFNISFESLDPGNFQFYEPMNTVNYTNNSSGINTGIMTVGSPPPTNSVFIFNFNVVGAGFQFDTQTTNTIPHQIAGTFYNSGEIRCESVLDGNNEESFGFVGFGQQEFFDLVDLGQCLVWATNIICPGTIDVSEDGFIQLSGQNVNLNNAVLSLEQGLVTSNFVNVSINSEGEGTDTNFDWDPTFDLTATNARASLPDNLYLSFPTSYFNEVATSPTNIVVRAVFIVNANSNVTDTVFVAPSTFDNEGALIQWSGTFGDPVTGLIDTNYLYLFHYYPGSFGLTNIFPVLSVGTPAQAGLIGAYNYLWRQGAPLSPLPTPTPAGFQNIFNNNVETNFYEFFNASLTGSTAGTNASSTNPSGALTNLLGRIQIVASNELTLANAQISGANYLSLQAPNQFDGSPGAQITSPYSDINLGVTNGSLTVSNLLAANMPQWGGTLNEWSTRWTNVDINGINWDYRVELVYSDLTPSIQPQVQNLTLTGTNLVISDVLNVFGSMFANAQILNLTTNGGGATSPDGELNMQEQDPLTWSWSGSFPDLLFLTNNGAIRMPNYSDFESTGTQTNFVATIPPIEASATLFETGPSNNIAAGGTVTILGQPYVFVSKLTNNLAFEVKVGTSLDGSMSNLIAAINRGPGAGTNYSTNTFASSVAVASVLIVTNNSFVLSANAANYPGTLGNGIPVSTTVTNLAWNRSTLAGGVNGIPGSTNLTSVPSPYGAIVNNGYLSDQGSTIWVTNFVNGGVIVNGPGSFDLMCFNATLTNGSITAGGDVSLTANTLVTSNLMLQAGRSLIFQVTNFLSDDNVSNANVWAVGATNGTGANGLVLPFLPFDSVPQLNVSNNLLGTTISLVTPPPNKIVSSYWAGVDYGQNTLGYNTNNVAIGQLVLNSQSASSDFYFSGPTGSTNNNAIYVDRLVLEGYAGLAYPNWQGFGGPPTLVFNNNANAGKLTIYYSDAVSSLNVNGGPLLEISSILNGLNGGHLVWVPQYAGIFSSTNVVYANGSINRLNVGLVTSPNIYSDGTYVPNSESSSPIFVGSQINLKELVVGNSNELIWDSPPGATNFVMCASTNFMNWNVAAIVTNSTAILPPNEWPITNVVYEPIPANTKTNSCWYRVKIIQNNSMLYGQ